MNDLAATNWILLVLAAAGVVQMLVVIALAVGALRAYRETAKIVDAKLTPALLRIEGLLTNLEHTSAVVRTRTDDVNRALDSARHTATHLGAVMWPRAAMVAGVAGGVLGVVKRWRASRRTQPSGTVVAG